MKAPDIIIAIDGFSSTGKSSLAKLVAQEFSFLYLDSGAMYRAVTLLALRKGFISSDGAIDEPALKRCLDAGADIHFEYVDGNSKTFIGNECVETEIRTLQIASHVSPISAIAFVRAFVDSRLRDFGSKGRVVMDGRDIGATVFPDAGLKIFLTASEEVRAQRRFDEMVMKGETPDFEEVRKNLQERDYIDSHREASPLRRAPDAFVLDNSQLSFEEEMAWIKGVLQGKFGILE